MMRIIALALCALVVPMATAAVSSVTVNSGGGADFATIQAAIASFSSTGANAAATPPFTITIQTPSGPYDEALDLNDANVGSGDIVGDLTIQTDTPGTKVVVKLQVGNADDGFYIYQSTANVTLIDLVFCPSLTNPFADDMVKVDENGANATMNVVTFQGCVFTEIDGAGNPLVTSRATAIAALPTANGFVYGSGLASGDVYLKCWGDAGESNQYVLDDCVFFTAGHAARLHNDGSAGESITVTDTFSYTDLTWNAALEVDNSLGGTVTIGGTGNLDDGIAAGGSTALISSGWHALWSSSTGGTGVASVELDEVMCYGSNPDTANHARGYSGGGGSPLVSAQDSIFVSDFICILDQFNNATTLDRCTLHQVLSPEAYWTMAVWPTTNTLIDEAALGVGSGSVVATDCVFSGADSVLLSAGAGPAGGFTIANSAIVQSGPWALADVVGYTDGGGNIVNNPIYVEAVDPTSASYLDVDNPAYAGVGSGGSNLAGGGTYIGSIPVELSIFSTN
ncbi:hypothetical protein JXA47_17650 [Candidatus Sumerlaeota bacterium]|nr:hypothetical protein [Candidatus Sumerlaeota bacterium]